MPDEYIRGARAYQPESHRSPATEHSNAGPVTIAEEPAFARSLFGDLHLSGRGNEPVRQAALLSMQRTHGNRAVQRQAVLTAEEQKKRQEAIKENVGKGTAALDLGQKTTELAMGDAAPKGLGLGMGGFIELMNRMASGQGILEAGGGAATQVAASAVGGSSAVTNTLGPASKSANVAGLIGSGMKFLGSMLGEKPEDIGIGDAGEYVSTGATLASPHMAFAQGMEGGLKSFYNTGSGVVDMIRTGDTKKLESVRESNLKGDNTSVIQGYAMMGELFSADSDRLDAITEANARGDNGALPQLGSKIGSWARDDAVPWLKDKAGEVGQSLLETRILLSDGPEGLQRYHRMKATEGQREAAWHKMNRERVLKEKAQKERFEKEMADISAQIDKGPAVPSTMLGGPGDALSARNMLTPPTGENEDEEPLPYVPMALPR